MDLLLCVVCVCALFSLSLHSIKPDKRHKRRFGCSTPQYKTRSSFPHRDFERERERERDPQSVLNTTDTRTNYNTNGRPLAKSGGGVFCALCERSLDAFERERFDGGKAPSSSLTTTTLTHTEKRVR